MMRISRRMCQSSALAGVGLFLACGSLFAQVNLYVPNYNNAPANLSEFSINTSTGALTPVVGQGTTTTDNNPTHVVMTPNNQFLYISSGNNFVDGYSVGPLGVLTPLPTPHYPLPGVPYGLYATNSFVYVTTSTTNLINVYSIGGNGVLTGPLACAACSTGAGSNPDDIVVDPTGNFIYVALNGTHQVGVGTIVQSGAALGTIGTFNQAAFTGPVSFAPIDVQLTPSGNALFVSDHNLGLPIGRSVFAFTVSGATLTPVTNYNSGTTVTSLPNGMAIDPTGKYLYVANQAENTVTAFSISGGTLTTIGSIGTGNQPTGVTVEPTGKFVYVSNQSDGTVSSYSIGGTGALTLVNTQPTGTGPFYLLAHLVPGAATVPATSTWSLAALGIMLAGIAGLLYRKAYR